MDTTTINKILVFSNYFNALFEEKIWELNFKWVSQHLALEGKVDKVEWSN